MYILFQKLCPETNLQIFIYPMLHVKIKTTQDIKENSTLIAITVIKIPKKCIRNIV